MLYCGFPHVVLAMGRLDLGERRVWLISVLKPPQYKENSWIMTTM
jgi:hypothetical protein